MTTTNKKTQITKWLISATIVSEDPEAQAAILLNDPSAPGENLRNGKGEIVWADEVAWERNALSDPHDRAAHWTSTFEALSMGKNIDSSPQATIEAVVVVDVYDNFGALETVREGERIISMRLHEIPGAGVRLEVLSK